MIKKWKKIKTIETYQCGKWYRVDKDEVLTPGSKKGNYFVARASSSSVAIIPLDRNGNIILTRQFRYSINKYSLEVPGGSGEKGKKILESAKRELEEETGMVSRSWKYVGKFNEAVGWAKLDVDVFVAKNVNLKKHPREDALDENVHENVICSQDELKDIISKNKIIDSFTLSALLLAYAKNIIK